MERSRGAGRRAGEQGEEQGGQGEEQGDRGVQQPVMTEGGEGGSKAEQRQVGEGNGWIEVEGKKRRKRRGTGEPGVPHTQGKRHAGAQKGTSALH